MRMWIDLFESLDRSAPFEWTTDTWHASRATFASGEHQYVVAFKHKDFLSDDRDLYACEFSSSDRRVDMIGGRDSFTILATVIKIIQEWIERHQPDVLGFSAEGESRMSLYNRLVDTLVPRLGNYEVKKGQGTVRCNFYLTKINS